MDLESTYQSQTIAIPGYWSKGVEGRPGAASSRPFAGRRFLPAGVN